MWRGLVVGEKYDKFLYSIYPQNIVSNWKTFSLSLGNASEEKKFSNFSATEENKLSKYFPV